MDILSLIRSFEDSKIVLYQNPELSGMYVRLFGKQTSKYEELFYIHSQLYVRLSECTSIHSFIALCCGYIKDIYGCHYGDIARTYTKYIIAGLAISFGVNLVRKQVKGSNYAYAQSTDKINFKSLLCKLKVMVKDINNFKDSDFIRKVSSFCSLLICTPIFVKSGVKSTWFGFSQAHDARLRAYYNNEHKANVCLQIADGCIYILEKVSEFLETGSISELFIDDKELAQYDENYTMIVAYVDKLNQLDSRNMTLEEYSNLCDKLIVTNKKFKSYYSNDKFKVKCLENQLSELVRAKWKADDKLNVRVKRKAPMTFFLYGPPGVGKSALTDKILHCLYENDKHLGESNVTYSQDIKYIYNPEDEYMSEFRTSHEVCILDDVDQFTSDIVKQRKGGSMAKLIFLGNEMPYITNQAALEDKGMIPFRCKYIIGTTNTYDGGMSIIFNKQGGAPRRGIWIEVNVKPEYRKSGELQLNGDFSDNGFKNHEMHQFSIRKYFVKQDCSVAMYWDKDSKSWTDRHGVTPPLSMRELSLFLLEEQRKHHKKSDWSEASVNHFMSSRFCQVCNVTGSLCNCAVAQSNSNQRPTSSNNVYHGSNNNKNFEINDIIKFFKNFLIIYYGMCLMFWYILHTGLDKFRQSPSMATDNYIYYLERMVIYEDQCTWLCIIPNCIKTRFVCGYWQDKLNCVCQATYNVSGLVNNIKKSQRARYVLMGATTILSVVALLKVFGVIKHGVSQSEDNSEPAPQPSPPVDNCTNYWKVDFEPVTRLRGPKCNITMDQMTTAIQTNVVRITLKDNRSDYEAYVNGCGIYGNYILMPKHIFDNKLLSLPCKVDVLRTSIKSSVGLSVFDVQVDSDNFFAIDGYDDVIALQHSRFGVFRDLRKFLLDAPFKGISKGVIVKRNAFGDIIKTDVHGFQKSVIKYKTETKAYVYDGYKAFVDEPTKDGDCGAPYIIQSLNGIFIGGLHIAAFVGTESVFATPVYSDINISNVRFVPHSYDGIDLNTTYGSAQDLTIQQKVHFKSPFRMLEKGNFGMLGTLNTHRRKLKTAVVATIMSERVLAHYGKLDFTHFSPKEVSSKIATFRVIERVGVKANFAPKYLRRAEDALFNIYLRNIKQSNKVFPSQPYNIDVGINGIDNIAYVDRLPVSTSGGFGHKGSKMKYFVELDPTPDHEVRYGITDGIKREYDNLLENYRNGIRGEVVWDSSFKDEPLSTSKIRQDKCRIFSSGPLHFSILLRQYYLWSIPYFYGDERLNFGMATGANAHGSDWTKLYKYITRCGSNRMIAGDYKAFDKSMPPEIMTAAFNVLIRICEHFGWLESDLEIMRGLATDTCYPLTNFFGTLVMLNGSNPSGQNMTTPINGMCNIMYMMMAGMMIEDELNIYNIDYNHFFDDVSIVTYGDDNCMSSKYDYFNHTSISKVLSRCGVTYTMADKETESIPFINVDEVSFLKRTFVSSIECPTRFLAPLEEASLIKSLSICTQSRSIMFETQCAQIIYSAMREYFHYGRTVFDAKRVFFHELCLENKFYAYLPENRLPSYVDLLDKFKHS